MLINRRATISGISASLALPAWAQAPANDGFRVLEAKAGLLKLLPDPATPTAVLGYDGMVPGPLLRLAKGEALKIRLTNHLDQPTAIHWQGVRIVNAMDGVASLTQAAIAPGGSFDYAFTPPDSGTFLYRASVPAIAAAQQARGLHGVLIVDEATPPVVDRDLVAILQDWSLDEHGQILSGASLVTLNGRALPEMHSLPAGARVRLRLVNASTARIAIISFEGVRPLVCAIDSQPCDLFDPVRRTIPIGPGARFDLFFDVEAQPARIILRGDNAADRTLIVLNPQGQPRAALPAIAALPANPLLPTEIRLQDSKKFDLVIDANAGGDKAPAWTLNGVSANGISSKPLFSVKAGTPVTLGLVNRSTLPHAIHVHGHHMRLLHDLDDGWEPYWRDSVLINAGRTHHVAFVADNPGKWLIECLMLAHGAAGLAGWFEVKEKTG